MKAFVVYVKGHKLSEKYMKACVDSLNEKNFDVELLEGVTPDTLYKWKDIEFQEIKNGRATDFKVQSKKTYNTKKACFTNHIRVWKECVRLNEPVAFIEQDATCVRPWLNTSFDEVIILNVESAFKQPVFNHVSNKPNFNLGKNVYKTSPLVYNKLNEFKGGLMIPGTAAYAITPKGAKKLLEKLELLGWDQSDFFVNTNNVKIEYIIPEYFSFTLKNLNMSHGF